MDLNMDVCRAIAVQHGLPLQFVIKEFHLMDVLGKVASIAAARPGSLVFKGGTALSKVYLQKLQRFSEDADFDLVLKNAESEMHAFCKALASGISGYAISEFRMVRKTIQFHCAYETPMGGKDNIRIDISPKRLVTARPIEMGTAVSEFTNSSVSGLPVYSLEDLTARKLSALASRAEGKDVYDVHTALPLCDRGVLRTAIGCMLESEGDATTTEEFIQRAIAKLERSNPGKLRSLTNPFIPLASRPKNWEELKNDLLLSLGGL